ncbi:alanine racemase [Endozoicomonas sp. SCSIO W0465]|uniref:alanine racemase n=1 Tax=Endozoicomonas sp. SCSIO W0465 TaxID=2918516 RepID=UPI002075C0D6|nr:alanine racemase [Endozoicomonas sp. SCSIO W0465]USE35941.1 alanine racemase [Endozoicomonas sp. SCSIO W0465]
MGRPATATINLDALRHNYRIAQQLSAKGTANGQVMAVVKADAYSHGATACATALADIANGFAVACIEEALELRAAGIKQTILLLEGFFEPSELEMIDQYRLDTVIHHQYQIDALVAHPLNHPVRLWLKMDSGMGRVGFTPDEYRKAWAQINDLSFVKDIVLMSHFACADESDSDHAQQQLTTFNSYTRGLPGERSFCNSAGLVALKEARGDWNRPGLLLYGISPFPDADGIEQNLKPVMELSSAIISIKAIPAGSSVGYGSRWIARRPTRIGVVAIGYADGYPRHAPNGTPVVINGYRVPLVGRVSMDMLTVDLTDLPDVDIGNRAILWGDDLPINEVAQSAGTIPYQLLCNLNRVPVQYHGLLIPEHQVFDEVEF